jgi:hypothetical protein
MGSQKPEEITPIIISAIEALESPHLQSELLKSLITPPLRERRAFAPQKAFWPSSGTAEGDVWLFFIIPSQPSIALAYSEEGYALLGRRWGLVWAERPTYGAADSWYESLIDLIVESGCFAID